MRKRVRRVLLLLAGLVTACAFAIAATGASSLATSVQRAPAHPMRYHLALPAGWNADREWPVLVVIPDAARDFEVNLERFARARGGRPYVLVAPEVLSCGAPTGEGTQAVKSCDQQTAVALREAREHGFHPRAVRVVNDADHGPLPEAVLAWCDSLRQR